MNKTQEFIENVLFYSKLDYSRNITIKEIEDSVNNFWNIVMNNNRTMASPLKRHASLTALLAAVQRTEIETERQEEFLFAAVNSTVEGFEKMWRLVN